MKHPVPTFRLCGQVVALGILGLVTVPAWGDAFYPRRPILDGYTVELLTQAPADEYYYGLGDPRNTYVSGGIDPAKCYVEAGNLPRPKVNEAYVWSLA